MNVLDIMVNEIGLDLVVIEKVFDLVVQEVLDLMMIVWNCLITLNL